MYTVQYRHFMRSIIIGIALVITRLTPFTFLPTAYYLTTSAIKRYLEKEAQPLPLNIDLFCTPPEWYFVMLGICAFGFLITFIFCKQHSFVYCIHNLICTAVPLSVRIVLVNALIFVATYGIICTFFGIHLARLPELSGISLWRPSSLLPHSVVKTVLTGAYKYVKAQTIFDQISLVSYYMFIATHVGALLSTVWFFIRLTCTIRTNEKE